MLLPSRPLALLSKPLQPTVKFNRVWPQQLLTLKPIMLLKINQARCKHRWKKVNKRRLLSLRFYQKCSTYSNRGSQVRSTRLFSIKLREEMLMK